MPDGQGGTLESPSQTGGVIRGSTVKAYLTPPEQPPPGEFLGLALAFGSVPDLEVLDTPVGRLATVISKDAWMIDVNDRFEAKGANVILQPEAFSDWGFRTDEWAPDMFKEGGFANLQKYPAWQREHRRQPDRQLLRHDLRRPEHDHRAPHQGRPWPARPRERLDRPEPRHRVPRDRAVDRARPRHRRPVADARRAPPAARRGTA